MRAAVFASGNGSNFDALASYFQDRTDVEIALLFSDQPKCYALERAQNYKIRSEAFSPKEFAGKADFEQAILKLLQDCQIDWIFLAGYMRLIGTDLLTPYSGRILNIHPSLLPKYPGKDSIQRAWEDQEPETGVTVHLVDEGMDSGPILKQQAVQISPRDTLASLEQKIHHLEHQLYPQVIETLLLENDKGDQ